MTGIVKTSALALAVLGLPFCGAAFAQGSSEAPTPTSAPAAEQNDMGATEKSVMVDMKSPDGKAMGTVEVMPTPHGLLFKADLTGLPGGTHAFHVHETGKCEGSFESAGGHYNPDGKDHGFLSENGPHAGDMPNFVASTDGTAKFEAFDAMVTLDGENAPLNDTDGSAIVVHQGADDYMSQPSGHAGDRLSCGVVYAAP